MTIFSLLLPLAVSAGVNLYFTVLIAGLSVRAGLVDGLPADMDFLASWPVLTIAGVMVVIEFFADKIPYVDNVWDFIHTIVRPAGALAIAFNLVPPDDPALRASAMLIAGGAAFTAHSSKASLRALVNTSPEPFSNTAVSLLEDMGVFGLVVLAVTFPMIALGVSLVVLALLVIVLVVAVRLLRRAGRSVWRVLFRRERPGYTVTDGQR